MASEGVSTNTIVLVAAAVVVYMMWQKRQDEEARVKRALAAARASSGGTYGGKSIAEWERIARDVGQGLGWLIGQFGSDDDVTVKSSDYGPGDPNFVGPPAPTDAGSGDESPMYAGDTFDDSGEAYG